ncbi:lipocalin family protein [Paenimyroides aestuarii]|uniref:Lipocalin family protein n=1 Tax=Paenimyroides aestuarii TaxID=2968490 RepID=A0ABY5NPI9_9FLAO|nr:lipocalin family protein [Paenimyroides aestuarii]UUV20419.1 lipocalin family protein [Paenimyroides aestuarii]
MKKVSILLFIAVLGFTSLTACSSDDSDTDAAVEQEKNHLLGKWNATSTHMKIEMDGKILIDNLDEEEGSTYGIIKTYEFKADNTVNYYTYIPASGSDEASESEGTTTYERKGNQLILKNSPYPYTILVLSENTLHLYNMFEVESEGSYIKSESIDKFERVK